MNDIVESIQQDILDPAITLNTILLKAKLLAHHLGNERFRQWVKYELDGYPDSDELPDYRVIYPPLLGYITNGWNGRKNQPISLWDTPDWFQEIADKVSFTPGIQALEEFAASKSTVCFNWPAEYIAIWNHYNPLGNGGHQCCEVSRPVSPSVFAQMLLTVRSRLQDFVLELSDIPWKMAKDSSLHDQIEQLVAVTIYNNTHGGTMTTFDQREQQVQSQNNAARDIHIKGNINVGTIQNTDDFIGELQKLKSELSKAGEAQIVDAEVVTDADYEIACAIQEAKKATPDKESILKPMEKAKGLLSKTAGAAEFVTALINLIAAVITLF